MHAAAESASESEYVVPAAWYDRIYAAMDKDYAGEAAIVDGIVRTASPGARSLLDVGCGTGLHLERFARLFDEVAGLDLDPRFASRARERCRGAQVHVADMCGFRLSRTFDVITCLFSAIGHVKGRDGLREAIAAMAAHLAPGGVLVIEPWLLPGRWRDGHVGVEVAEGPDSTLVRVNHSGSDGEVSVLRFAWTEATPAGITRMDELLRLTRFAHADYQEAFDCAGLDARFDEAGCNDGGRGLWVARA